MSETQTNGYDGDKLNRYLDAIDREDDKLAAFKEEYMERCKEPRERIKDTLTAAEENGVNVVAFRTLLKKHRGDRRQERHVAKLEPDDAMAYDLMREALGVLAYLPLGQAALNRVRPATGDETLSQL